MSFERLSEIIVDGALVATLVELATDMLSFVPGGADAAVTVSSADA